MPMPDHVEVYKSPKGKKYHLQPCCAGGNAEMQKIHEIEFLHLLRGGEVCRGCIGDPKQFTSMVERDIVKKISIQATDERIRDGDVGFTSFGDKIYTITVRLEIDDNPV